MSENTDTQKFDDLEAARRYVDQVRELYRNDEAEYRGRRTPEQQIIAEVTSEEARLLIDGAFAGILAISGASLPEDYEGISMGGHTWKDFRSEFSRLLVGFGVLTNRLERDKHIDGSYADFREQDRIKVASVLLTDFLRHNALRFGVDTAGIRGIRTVREHNAEGGITERSFVIDKDKAKDSKEVERNMRQRRFSTEPATHPAGKMSPEEAIQLRREYPEMEKDAFDRDISFYTNARQKFEEHE